MGKDAPHSMSSSASHHPGIPLRQTALKATWVLELPQAPINLTFACLFRLGNSSWQEYRVFLEKLRAVAHDMASVLEVST
jgi:hypothetical protein